MGVYCTACLLNLQFVKCVTIHSQMGGLGAWPPSPFSLSAGHIPHCKYEQHA